MPSEDNDNPNDPEFLASRALDESLTDQQRQLLSDHLGELDELRRIDALVQSLRDEKVDIDWAAFQQTIQDRITCAYDDAELERVDEIVECATEVPATWDEKRFTQDVLQLIESNTQLRPSSLRWMKVAMPLAAAAAIALMVTIAPWQNRPAKPISIVAIGPSIRSGTVPANVLSLDNAVALVSFRREPIVADNLANSRSRVSFVSVGAEPVSRRLRAAPPL